MLQWGMSFNLTKKKIHFIGICGAGMSAVAILLKETGWDVTGSDANFYPPVSTYLENSQIKFFKGYKKENIPSGVDVIVIGKHAELTPELNEEVRTAFEIKVQIKSFAEILGEATKDRENIVIAGSYGKSTCATLLAWCLEYAHKEPGYFIGAIPITPTKSSVMGRGGFFIIEGDEYPSANWDDSSKFLHYHPSHLLLTSLAHDHVNVFKTVADYRAPFRKLINLLPIDGLLVACADGDEVIPTLKELGREAILYSVTNKAMPWHVENISYSEISSFDIIHANQKVAHISTELLGQHNIENILGVSALLLERGAVTAQVLEQAIQKFKAPQRRLNKISDQTIIPIYEGFGSSHDKAVSAIKAMRLHFPSKKLLVIFEPHTFSWRSRDALGWYDTVFSGVDKVLIYKPPLHGAQPEQLQLGEILERVKKQDINVVGFESTAEGHKLFEETITKDSVILIISSGGFDGAIEDVKKITETKFPNK